MSSHFSPDGTPPAGAPAAPCRPRPGGDDGAALDPGSPAARRRAARALGDAALVAALAAGDAAACAEFDARFRPLLEVYARRVRVPPALWPQCVDEVLEDEAMRFADGAPAPDQLGAYLVRASYHRLLRARRAAARRERRYGAGSADAGAGAVPGAERIVLSVVSAAALRASSGPRAADGAPAGWDDPGADPTGTDPTGTDPTGTDPAGADAVASAVIARAAAAFSARLTDAERQLLVWVAEQVPRRQIAEWVGEGYEATRKRIQRLTRRLQADAVRLAAELPAAERHEFERFLRRAGRPVGGAAGAARAGGAATPFPRAAPPGPSGGTDP